MRYRPPPACRGVCGNKNAGSPGEVRLCQTGDIFKGLVLVNPAGVASPGRDQSAGYARRRHSDAIADAGSIPAVSTPRASPRVLTKDPVGLSLFHEADVPPPRCHARQLTLRTPKAASVVLASIEAIG